MTSTEGEEEKHEFEGERDVFCILVGIARGSVFFSLSL